MAKVTLTRISSMVNAPTTINGILTEIESAFDNTLSRDGDAPNAMTASLDMNSQRILNLPAPASANEPARKADIQPIVDAQSQTFAARDAAQASAAAAAGSASAAAASAATAATAGANAAQAVIDAAQADIDASVAEANAQADLAAGYALIAEQALVAISGAGKANPSAVTLVSKEGEGLAIVAEAVREQTIAVIDPVTGANTTVTDLSDWLPTTAFPSAKMVTQRDGSINWAAHNLLTIVTEDLSSASYTKTQMTALTGQNGPTDGSTNGNLLTATGTGAKIAFTAANQLADGYFSLEVLAAPTAGSAPYLWIGVATVKTWFDMTNGSIGTVGAGITANVYTTNGYGEPLTNGYRRLVVRYKAAGTTTACEIGFSTADNSTTSENGQAVLVTCVHARRGLKEGVGYLKGTGAARYGVPYHWIDGRKGILIEPSGATYYGKYSDDLTNVNWTATNVTTAFTQIGPDNAPCTLLTATSNGGTVSQAITSASTKWSFAPYIKRIVGTGSIELSLDGGSTWTNVTSQVLSNVWTRPGIYHTGANPTIAIRLGTSGDQIAVSKANAAPSSSTSFISSPQPTYNGTSIRASDVFTIPVSQFNYQDDATLYADLRFSSDAGENTQPTQIGVAGSQFIRYGRQNGTIIRSMSSGLTTLTSNPNAIYTIDNAQNEAELSLSFGVGRTSISVNGEPTLYMHTTVAPSGITDIRVTGFSVTLFSLLYTTNLKTDDQLRTWMWSGRNRRVDLLDDATLQKYGAGPFLESNRIPTGLFAIDDNPSSATLLAMWCPNNKIANTTGIGEWPQYTAYRRFFFDKTTKRLSPVDLTTQVFEKPGFNGVPGDWENGYGLSYVPVVLKIKGPNHPGRVIVLYIIDDTPTPTDENVHYTLNQYMRYTDDAMSPTITWSDRRKLLDLSQTGLASPGRICVNDIIQLPATSAWPYRILVSLQDTQFRLWTLWSDDGGDNWTFSSSGFNWTTHGVIGPEGEISMGYMPGDDSVSFIQRQRDQTGTYGKMRCWAKSTDGGQTVTFQGGLSEIGQVSGGSGVWGSQLQVDPTGSLGTWGRQYYATATGGGRQYFKIQSAVDANLTFGNPLSWISEIRYVGYNKLAYMSGGFMAISYETGTVGFNYDNTSHLAVLKVVGP